MKKSLVIFLLFLLIIFRMYYIIKSNRSELFSPNCPMIIGINSANNVFINTTCGDINSIWTKLNAPKFKETALTNNNGIYGIGIDDKIYYAEYSTTKPTTFKLIDGLLLNNLNVDKKSNTPILVGVDKSNTGYYADARLTSNPNWVQMTSLPNNEKFKQIVISNQKLYAISLTDQIYYGKNYKNPNWKKVNGFLSQISMENNVVVGVNSSGNIFYTENLENPQWIRLEHYSFKYISICNNKIFGIDYDNWMFYNNYYNHVDWNHLKWSRFLPNRDLIQFKC
jgi:hypothetical protein